MMRGAIILTGLLIATGTVFFSGCVEQEVFKSHPEGPGMGSLNLSGYTQKIKKFSSMEELQEFLMKTSAIRQGERRSMLPEVTAEMNAEEVAESVAVPASKSVERGGASEYSTTNVQVAGVDEADFVKNDDEYIYVITQNKLVLLDAYPPENASLVSTTRLPGNPRGMFVSGNRLVLFSEDTRRVAIYQKYDFKPHTRYAPVTNILVYDITNRENPVPILNYTVDGNYFQSRRIGDYVYLITRDSLYYLDDAVDVPEIRESTEKILTPEVYYFDNPEQNYVFHTITSLNIQSGELNASTLLTGYSDNLYVSASNIYITYRKSLPPEYYQKEQQDAFYRVVVPLLPPEAQERIKALQDSESDSTSAWNRISQVLSETYANMSKGEREALFNRIDEALAEYASQREQARERTVIQKFKINRGEISFETRGEVPGTLLNQFSMDEHRGYLRVATTSQIWRRHTGTVEFNNVYILDPSLNITGRLEHIAEGERIFSTRFMGERLYMVTFKRMDPLFVVDLSDVREPRILGKLKIPGFSDYLHPYDENHIIGIGKETGTSEWGGVSIKGVKLALFDVSDVEHPVQVDSYEIGTSGTDSEALHDHKAFLFDREKNLLVLPVREILKRSAYDEQRGYYRVWQGAYVFNVTLEGFRLRGRITHFEDYEPGYYYWRSPWAVRRSLYMDDTLYTISERKIMMHRIQDLEMINSINLPYEPVEKPVYVIGEQ